MAIVSLRLVAPSQGQVDGALPRRRLQRRHQRQAGRRQDPQPDGAAGHAVDGCILFVGQTPRPFGAGWPRAARARRPSVASVTFNIVSVSALPGVGEIANPLSAHPGCAADERVHRLPADGAGQPGVAPVVTERCSGRAAGESLMR